MKKLVVLTGSGISAESGLKTFRDSDGLWENYDVMEVASIDGWERNHDLVLRFYNERRTQLKNAEPNAAHFGLVDLEDYFDVHIITQNVDNLHEKAGSKNILHLHGVLTRVRSTGDPFLVYDIGYNEIHMGDTCESGYQLRPDIVWFGEPVPAFEKAVQIAGDADILAVIGSSLVVYPAAGLMGYVPPEVPVFVVDPAGVSVPFRRKLEHIREKAGKGIGILKEKLIAQYLS
jgi:NAD-dependent deacetylase